MTAPAEIPFTFEAFAEDTPGDAWASHFRRLWPAYRRWFLRDGEQERPTYLESERALRRYLPEWIPVWEQMVERAGGGDHAARFLSQFNPPPLFRGCSQAVYRADQTVMVRSYDYCPWVFDGLLMKSRFRDRQVIAMLDGMAGALDGMNDDGLAVSLSFGGREEFGDGFGIALVIRYLLEFCGDVDEACERLRRIPVQGAYNVMLLDAAGHSRVIAVAAGRDLEILKQPVATNHQADSHWPLYEEKVLTRERQLHLEEMVASGIYSAEQFSRQFLLPPLYQDRFAHGFGTLYDAAFYPASGRCEYFWPEQSWQLGFDTPLPEPYTVTFVDPAGATAGGEVYGEVYTARPVPALLF